MNGLLLGLRIGVYDLHIFDTVGSFFYAIYRKAFSCALSKHSMLMNRRYDDVQLVAPWTYLVHQGSYCLLFSSPCSTMRGSSNKFCLLFMDTAKPGNATYFLLIHLRPEVSRVHCFAMSNLDVINLFSVKDMVFVITGGGSGIYSFRFP
jgi:hypothetical protein